MGGMRNAEGQNSAGRHPQRGDCHRVFADDHWRARCWETSTAGSGSDKWKRAQSDWVPRQLSTSLGKRQMEKGPRGYLASCRLHSGRDKWKRARAGTSLVVDFTREGADGKRTS